MIDLDTIAKTARKAIQIGFDRSVANTLARMTRAEVLRLLELNDVYTLIQEFAITADDLAPLQDAVEESYHAAASAYTAKGIPARYRLIPFNRRHLRAEQAIKEEGGRLIADITADSRAAIQQAVMRGLRQGSSPARLATDLAGVYDRAAQVRRGGIIGLSRVQEGWAAAAADELAMGNPRYLRRVLRDRRYDPLVKKALAEGRPLRTDEIMRLTQRYRDKLVRSRAETIARTETHTVLNMGRFEKIAQTAERAGVGLDKITVKWQAARDGRVRDTHGHLRGKTAQYGQPFSSGGHRLRYPGDRSLGAPASEIVNCRCNLTFEVDLS